MTLLRRSLLWLLTGFSAAAVLLSVRSYQDYRLAEVSSVESIVDRPIPAVENLDWRQAERPWSREYGQRDLAKSNHLVQEAINESASDHRLVLVVNKAQLNLTAYQSGYRVAEFRVKLEPSAFAPAATPEGTYYIATKSGSGETANREGPMVDCSNGEEYGAFDLSQGRHRSKLLRIIGDIGFQCGRRRDDWILGCIVLDNQDMNDLFQNVPVGTLVAIVASETVQSARKLSR